MPPGLGRPKTSVLKEESVPLTSMVLNSGLPSVCTSISTGMRKKSRFCFTLPSMRKPLLVRRTVYVMLNSGIPVELIHCAKNDCTLAGVACSASEGVEAEVLAEGAAFPRAKLLGLAGACAT